MSKLNLHRIEWRACCDQASGTGVAHGVSDEKCVILAAHSFPKFPRGSVCEHVQISEDKNERAVGGPLALANLVNQLFSRF